MTSSTPIVQGSFVMFCTRASVSLFSVGIVLSACGGSDAGPAGDRTGRLSDDIQAGTWSCEAPKVIDFDFAAGTRVENAYADWGVAIEAQNNRAARPSLPIVFNSASPSGGDEDLRAENQGGVLIISENDIDRDGDGRVDVPDDERAGGTLTFRFAQPVIIAGVKILDSDSAGNTLGVNRGGDAVFDFDVPVVADGELQSVDLFDVVGDTFTVKYSGSGAVDDLAFCVLPEDFDPPSDGEDGQDDGEVDPPSDGEDGQDDGEIDPPSDGGDDEDDYEL